MVCKNMQSDGPFQDQEIILGLEWLPTEINLYINGKWRNGFKYTTESSWIIKDGKGLSVFTCLDFTHAVAEQIHLSLSLNYYPGFPPVDLTKNWKIDYIRSYKLVGDTTTDYWPSEINTGDVTLSRVHKTVHLGGENGHYAIVPSNCCVNVWAKDYVLLDKGFTLTSGTMFIARAIDTDPNLFNNYTVGNNEQ
jgi:hypothetical protein